MADIFLSYSRKDRHAAETLARALAAQGFSVWWDRDIAPGQTFDDSLERELHSATAVVVLLSSSSAESEWVRLEALAESERGRVIPVLIHQGATVPPYLRSYRAADLGRWEGSSDHPEFRSLVAGLNHLVLGASPERQRGLPGLGAGRAASPERPSVAPDPTQFGVSSPSLISSSWSILRAYLYPQSEEGQVSADSRQLQKETREGREFGSSVGSSIRKGTVITVSVELPCAEIRGNEQRFRWKGHWQKTDFGVRCIHPKPVSRQKGTVSWFAGVVCIGQVEFTVECSPVAREEPLPNTLLTAAGYEKVFVSYSTQDRVIVDWLETTYVALGMTYLRDVKSLRSGEVWNKRLLDLIREADLFQLCWSTNAKRSTYVADEWRFALGLKKQSFIRPCYWEEPLPEPPPELKDLHFVQLKANWVTRIWFRFRGLVG